MHVEDLMIRQVHSCRPDDSLEHAANLMWDHDCGCVPVCSGDGLSQIVGMITDRDICMSALFQGKPLKELRVGEAMSKSVETCHTSDSLGQAEQRMRKARVRRLPVLDANDAFVGIISLADLAREAAQERGRHHRQITETEVGDTLAAICETPKQSIAA